MPTIIESLIVTLGLDSKDVDAKAPGVRRKLSDFEKDADKAQKSTKGFGNELTNVSSKLGSFLAVLGGAVAVRAFVKDTIETNTQLYFLSRNLDINTQKLFAWGAAAQEIGGSKVSVQNFFRSVAQMQGQMAIGQTPQLLPLFARLGINFNEDPDKLMLDLSKKFAEITKSRGRQFAYGFGVSSGLSEDMMNLILQGPKALQNAQARDKRFSPTDRETESATRLKRVLTDLQLQFLKIGYDILYKVTPYLEKFFKVLQQIGAWAQSHEKIVAIIAGIAAALAGVAALGTALGGVALAWGALIGAITAAMPALAVVGLVVALGSAILLLWQDYQVWCEGGKSAFNWGDFAAGIDACSESWKTLSERIESATDSFNKWAEKYSPSSVGEHLREKFDSFMGNTKFQGPRDYFLGDLIAGKEGFYAPEKDGLKNVPQRAHNPGDIEYGDFARSHGATGFVLAKGGKKIATFVDDKAGFNAMYALLGSKSYAGLSQDQVISKWQTGSYSSLLDGIPNAAGVPASVSSVATSSSSTHDNSRTTHINTINIQNPANSPAMTPSMARGMDWSTLLTQQNFGLMP